MSNAHKVSGSFRFLAGVIAVCGVVVLVAKLQLVAGRGPRQAHVFDALVLLGMFWLTIPMAWVAFVGRVPVRWPGFGIIRLSPPSANPATGRVFDPDTRLLGRDDFVVPDSDYGLEMLNDAKTPMDFVVDQLTTHVALARDDAVKVMLQVHTKGGALLPMASESAARDAADRISEAASVARHPLVCRFVDFRKA